MCASRLLAALPLWLMLLPATYGLLRNIVLMDVGKFDEPTELVWRDRAGQVATAVFVALTGWAMLGGAVEACGAAFWQRYAAITPAEQIMSDCSC